MGAEELIGKVGELFNQAIYGAHQGMIDYPAQCRRDALRLLALEMPASSLQRELEALCHDLGYREGHVVDIDLAHIPALA